MTAVDLGKFESPFVCLGKEVGKIAEFSKNTESSMLPHGLLGDFLELFFDIDRVLVHGFDEVAIKD